MKWNNKGHQFDLIGEKIRVFSETNAAFYIWGAGTFGISFYEMFQREINIEAFVDSAPQKQGTMVCGIPVYAPECLKEKKVFVLVSAGWTRDIYNRLSEFGYIKGQDCLHIDDFTSLYHWYKYKKVCLSDITYAITEYCSLRCENCNAFVPRIQNPENIPINQIIKDFDQFFKYVDQVNVLGLSGGDAMVHPEFADIVEALGERYYPNKAVHLEVYCNAVIVPDRRTLQVLKKYNVFYRFSDYRPYTNGRQRVEEIVSLLIKNGIRYDHVSFETWCDCGYPQSSNGISGEENLVTFFDTCDRKSCHRLCDGVVTYCGMVNSADRIDYCRLETPDVFDISDYDPSRRVELIEYMLGYSEKGFFNYCRICNGSFNVNKKTVEAGKQLS